MGAVRLVAMGTALVAAAGLVLQYVLIVGQLGPALGTWRFIGYFTILSNAGVAAIAGAIALGSEGRLAGARARLMGLTAIVTVGFVYSVLLRSLWSPTGWQKIADALLHDVTPILFAILWATAPHGRLKWSDLQWALAPPALYLAYAMGRGAIDRWYPYYFLDPALQTSGELALGIVGVLAVFAIIAGGAIAVDMRIGRTKVSRVEGKE